MGDLLVMSQPPQLGGGMRMRTYGIARALAASGPLDVLYPDLGEGEPSREWKSITGITFNPVRPSRGAGRLTSYLEAMARGVPPSFARGVSRELVLAVEELADAPGRRRVVADGPIAAALSARLARRSPVIYNAHNLESAFRREARAGGDPLSTRMLPRFERAVLRRSSEAWMVSRKDMDGSLELAPDTPVRLVPNVVDVAAVKPVAPAGRQSALLVASFGWPPNREAADFLAGSVMPRVWQRLPEARLTFVGRGLEDGFGGDERIELRGFVDDLRDAYSEADCVVVPLLTGGGSPLKFVEALAYGLPVVATSHAAAGLEAARAGEHYREADGPEAFADALADILEHGSPELASRGRALAESNYSIEALTRILAPQPALEVAS